MTQTHSGFVSLESLKIEGAFNEKINNLPGDLQPGQRCRVLSGRNGRLAGIMVSVRLEGGMVTTVALDRIDISTTDKNAIEGLLSPAPYSGQMQRSSPARISTPTRR